MNTEIDWFILRWWDCTPSVVAGLEQLNLKVRKLESDRQCFLNHYIELVPGIEKEMRRCSYAIQKLNQRR